MHTQRIIVIGASAGGFEAIKKLVMELPEHLEASILIVWHMSPDMRGFLSQALNRVSKMHVTQAYDGEKIVPSHIYVAPPDHHMLIEQEKIRVSHGPRENRFRPAIDPLFRSAAYTYRSRVIGVVLSGALDDGTAGLWTVKRHSGIAIVQDPQDAEVPSMPANALREVAVDHITPMSEMAGLLVRLSQSHKDADLEAPSPDEKVIDEEARRLELEIQIAADQTTAFEAGIMQFGELSPYTCPECHGALLAFKDGKITRFRCHTGHAYSPYSLLTAVTESIEGSLYDAIRGIEESVILLNHLGDHFAEGQQKRLAAMYFQNAREAQSRALRVRQALRSQEQLSQNFFQLPENLAAEQQDAQTRSAP